jgi:DNA-binding CsgD family transcriptional regulator
MMDGRLLSERDWVLLKKRLKLSPRQADVVRHIMDGRSDRQIADELSISLVTVRTHIRRLFRRFDLNDRLELTLHVLKSVRSVGEHNATDSERDASHDLQGRNTPSQQ